MKQCRLRTGYGPENMAIFSPIAVNLMRTTRAKSSLEVRRKKAGRNTGHHGDVLNGVG